MNRRQRGIHDLLRMKVKVHSALSLVRHRQRRGISSSSKQQGQTVSVLRLLPE